LWGVEQNLKEEEATEEEGRTEGKEGRGLTEGKEGR